MDNLKKRQEYLDERKYLMHAEAESYKSFGQSLLLVTTGALALSVTFITSLEVKICTEYAVIAWVGWVVSIYFQLSSKVASARALSEAQDIITEAYSNDQTEYRDNPYNQKVHKHNFLSLAAFSFGTVVFLCFVYKNLNL